MKVSTLITILQELDPQAEVKTVCHIIMVVPPDIRVGKIAINLDKENGE